MSALHLYGPSRTTVAKVVAIAKLSPGIVRFYFKSKAAMLIAALQYLATEFEDRVLAPVEALRGQPVDALKLLVELYLDPDIASPRKIAVWYAFWGEASARQEYLDICGQTDEKFAAVVGELIGRMIELSGRRHLDRDAVAFGLIGVLEMLWQGFAFQEEVNIDRALARQRCMAYLRSVFPREFAIREGGIGTRANPRGTAAMLQRPGGPAAPLAETWTAERERCFRDAWQCVGHEQEIPGAGDYLTLDLAETRALVVRDSSGAVRAFRNTCRRQPHALALTRRGHFTNGIACLLHGLSYGLDGRALRQEDGAGLIDIEVCRCLGLIFVRSASAARQAPSLDVAGLQDASDFRALRQVEPAQWPVDADWKIVVTQLLESRLPHAPIDAWAMRWSAPVLEIHESGGAIRWHASGEAEGNWSAARLRPVAAGTPMSPWRRHFLWPNMLVEQRLGSLSVLQVLPIGPGQSRLQQFEYATRFSERETRARAYLLRRLMRAQLERELALAVSTQQGTTDPGYEADTDATPPPAVAAFRQMLRGAVS
jgi:TetR/AcrR family transcriptional repressor of bet genes